MTKCSNESKYILYADDSTISTCIPGDNVMDAAELIKIIRVCNKDKPWFDDQCTRAIGLKQEAHLRWTRDRSLVNWEEFVLCQVRADETYSEAKRQFSDRYMDVLMNAQSPYRWWSTI